MNCTSALWHQDCVYAKYSYAHLTWSRCQQPSGAFYRQDATLCQPSTVKIKEKDGTHHPTRSRILTGDLFKKAAMFTPSSRNRAHEACGDRALRHGPSNDMMLSMAKLAHPYTMSAAICCCFAVTSGRRGGSMRRCESDKRYEGPLIGRNVTLRPCLGCALRG